MRPSFRVRALVFVLAVLAPAPVLLAACSGGDETLLTQPDRTRSTPQFVPPAETFARYLHATARGDAAGAWALLSSDSRRRLGPSLAAFRENGFRGLARRARPFRRGFRIVVADRITQRWGLAAATAGGSVYGSALRLDDRRWSVEIGGPVRIEPVRPEPRERVRWRTQIAAEVKADEAIEEAHVWLDGRALPSLGGGPTARALTMFGESGELTTGRHSAVAFAATRTGARAYAWSFTARARNGKPVKPTFGPA
jgi:hypothetical protein